MPTLSTDRLRLRSLALADAPAVQSLLADYDIAAGALNIPHPYPEGYGEYWIRRVLSAAANSTRFPFALVRWEDNLLVGTVNLLTHPHDRRDEMGYWLGKPFWRQGYMTEAVRRVVQFAFEDLQVNRLQAACFSWNVASARVMQKVGMTHEGQMRQHVLKWGKFEDLDYYGLVHDQWQEMRTAPE